MPKTKSGIFISFEGTEGSGKSTLIQEVASQLGRLNLRTRITREPGGSSLAEKMRALILQNPMPPLTELFLYEAARSEHMHQVILPALEQGQIILCDRFTDSTLAYQAYTRGLPWKSVQQLNQIATSGIKPHLTVFLDIDPETGLRRAQDPNRFEAEGVDFQVKVRKGYLKAKKEDPKRWFTLKVLDHSPEVLGQKVLQEIRKRFRIPLGGKA